MLILKALISLCPLSSAVAVTVYGQIPFGHVTQSQAQASATAGGATPTATPLAAYDNTVLKPMPLPDQPPPTRWTLELQDSGVNVPNLSIRMPGSFYGFSIEMSVITQVGESQFPWVIVCRLTPNTLVGKNSFVCFTR